MVDYHLAYKGNISWCIGPWKTFILPFHSPIETCVIIRSWWLDCIQPYKVNFEIDNDISWRRCEFVIFCKNFLEVDKKTLQPISGGFIATVMNCFVDSFAMFWKKSSPESKISSAKPKTLTIKIYINFNIFTYWNNWVSA